MLMLAIASVILKMFLSSDVFIAVLLSCQLIKFNVLSNSMSIRSYYPESENARKVEQILKLGDTVYVSESWIEHFAEIRLNPSESSTTWEETKWKEKYKRRNYIAIDFSMLAVEVRDYNFGFTEPNIVTENVDMYDKATGEWTALQNMNEVRAYHTSVKFHGLICAVGGKDWTTLEYYNSSTYSRRYLPKMNTMRKRAAAGN